MHKTQHLPNPLPYPNTMSTGSIFNNSEIRNRENKSFISIRVPEHQQNLGVAVLERVNIELLSLKLLVISRFQICIVTDKLTQTSEFYILY